MKIYISGPISGREKGNQDAFYELASKIILAGHIPVNPHDICYLVKHNDWNGCMKVCIKTLCDCDRIIMLPDWENSKGAKIEKRIANELGIKGVTIDDIEDGIL